MFYFRSAEKSVYAGEGATRKLLGRGGNLMMAEVRFQKDSIGAIHSHQHEQVSYIVEGSFEFHLDGDVQRVVRGDSVYIPPNTLHGVKALEENSIILDVFTPQRDDFI